MQHPSRHWAPLDRELVERILKEDRLPNAQQQADSLIIYLGENLQSPEAASDITPAIIGAIIGTLNDAGVSFITNQLQKDDFIYTTSFGSFMGAKHAGRIGLTFKGWKEYEKLKRTFSESRTAFMAMKFDNEALSKIVANHFKPAVAQTGFDLRRLDERQTAGIIDNRMRAEIQAARFLVADLSDRNNGVYFEAGYAEGLGRPVFYTCEESVFAKRHFDTEHHLTIKWNEKDPAKAATGLKEAIRATLRGEAKLTDD